jgi:NodT family efflux transporter outer membrane factor (OMF) lipoprotein
MTLRLNKSLLPFAALLLASACTIGPKYRAPDVATALTYKELGGWRPAHPSDPGHGPWWQIYHDRTLTQLEQQVVASNQSLKASEAAYREAVATVQEAGAGYFPTVTADGGATRSRKGGATGTQYSAGADASWVPDLWGRVRQTVESQKATAEASADDLAAATLSLQGTLAIDYFELRGADQQKRLLNAEVEDDKKSLKIATNQYKAGFADKSAVDQAQAQLDSVHAQALNVGVQRAALEHAIAVLIGKPPGDFTLKPAGDLTEPPVIPPGVPSALLERRPDIASAERHVAAANAQIGVAETAYFPDLTLSASEGFASGVLSRLISAPSNVWSLGADLAGTLFDGGLRAAKVREAKATYDQQVALYRQTTLTSFQQVEDDLAALRILQQEEAVQRQAVKASAEATRIIRNQYKNGTVAYTNVLVAEVQENSDRVSELSVRQNRYVQSVQLIEALGGGWNGSQPALVKAK